MDILQSPVCSIQPHEPLQCGRLDHWVAATLLRSCLCLGDKAARRFLCLLTDCSSLIVHSLHLLLGETPMTTPPRLSYSDVIAVLGGGAPLPPSKFISFAGELNSLQVQRLADQLQASSMQGGIRLKGAWHSASCNSFVLLSALSLQMPYLLGLQIAGCMLQDLGAQLVASALRQNSSITTLELPGEYRVAHTITIMIHIHTISTSMSCPVRLNVQNSINSSLQEMTLA